MRVGRIVIPLQEEKISIEVRDEFTNEKQITDSTRLVEYFEFMLRKLNEAFATLVNAINVNDASSMLIEEGGSLPTAGREHNGRFATLEKSGGGGEDQLYWCRWNGAAWEWKEII